MKEHRIATVLDMLALSEDEFFRMLPDLVTWFSWAKSVSSLAEVEGAFTWVDDGRAGEIHSVIATIVRDDGEPTGEVMTLKGSAYVEPS
jgi:hypothetical protein